ncbi:large proline-rich protein BAG6 [Hylaeus volcanicus]|uniref:large proline-rich protein BAG6 n=1 Tax=Hylaeus volcanicus TaxID=313075 RepID=UPI0023B7C286|nr:large proline-rich protein BAG6 [Hylaeus volcanicus]XP_053976345.1 large proline-rich protein BAG6 [Hylaeus volcanicus]
MIDLTVKTLDSQNHAFSLENDQITVRGFKEHIAESVSVPADSQRLIYCGRVLQDDKKLNDYDVNGKVIHLVQRAPPQPGQQGNDHGFENLQAYLPNLQRSLSRVIHDQMYGNAMYLGAMAVPAEIVEGHGLAVPQLSNSLSSSRLNLARRMLQRANALIERLDDPDCPLNPTTVENNQPPITPQVQVQQLDGEQLNNEDRTISGTRITEATVAAIAAALSTAGANNVTLVRGNFDDGVETVPLSEANDDNQSDTQQPPQPSQSEQQGSTSNNDAQSTRQSTLPRPPQMAELLELLLNAQDSLRPYIEHYRQLMVADRSLPRGAGGVEESQRIVDGVSQSLHYISHACHALSDIIVDMTQQPPRNLRCRPIIIQHSAILQPGIPIQVEAHISLHGRNANNNNGGEENADSANTVPQSESNEATTEETNQQPGQEAASQQTEQQQEQTQSPFGTVFNLPNNVEVLMEVSPENNMDAPSGNEQPPTGENNNNNNNNNGGRVGGTIGSFTWGSAPPPDFIRNLMQAAGYMVQGGITSTTITTQNPPTGGQQTVTSSLDGNTNAGQSTQARSNVGTHPTTATQTRSTSRPHVFHQQAHSLGVGMSIGQGLDFDPFLPCNSHHVRRTSTTTSSTVTSTPQGTRTARTSTPETQSQPQTATTSTTTNNTSPTNTTVLISSQERPTRNLIRQLLRSSGQPLGNIGFDINNRRILGDDARASQMARSLANTTMRFRIPESVHNSTPFFTSQNPENEENFFINLISVISDNMSIRDLSRLPVDSLEPIVRQRLALQEFFQNNFPNTTTETLHEQVAERLLPNLRPHIQSFLPQEEMVPFRTRNGSRIDINATIEALLRRYIKYFLSFIFDSDIDDERFGEETREVLLRFLKKTLGVLQYVIGFGPALEIISHFLSKILELCDPVLRRWIKAVFLSRWNIMIRFPERRTPPLLIYKNETTTPPTTLPSAPAHQRSQTQSEVEHMETEIIEERTNSEASALDDSEEIPERFPGQAILPSDWVPIIAQDGVRQRRQVQTQEMTNGGVATFSDAYIGTLPIKRRKLYEQQKPQLLVSPTPNHSVVAASMERLVREGVTRAGVEEVDGAAVAVAVDPGVRRAFGQAIRECLNPRRYETPDFPDPVRFPNATKYFADQDRPPK